MKCGKCDNDMFVDYGYDVVENDDTAECETKLFHITVQKCMNPECPDFLMKKEERLEQMLGAPEEKPELMPKGFD